MKHERRQKIEEKVGFEIPRTEVHRQFEKSYKAVRERRLKRWDDLLKFYRMTPEDKTPKIKRFMRKGVPHKYRPYVWMTVTNAQTRMNNSIGLYKNLLTKEKDVKILEQIELDISRTFPDNRFFRDDSKQDKKKLYNILVAYSEYNKGVGYCQGMNYVAGLIILVLRDEEKSFWLLVCLLNEILPESYFSKTMEGLLTDCDILKQLIVNRFPDVGEHDQDQWNLVSVKWLVCLYIDVLPIQTTLRIWDCLLYEGHKVIFRVALALFGIRSERVRDSKNLPDFVDALNHFHQDKRVVNCHHFMSIVFDEKFSKLSQEELDELRNPDKNNNDDLQTKPKRAKSILIHQCATRVKALS